MHRQRLGDFQLEQPRRRAGGVHRLAQAAEEARVVELAPADVDRQPLLDSHPAPARDRHRDGIDHPLADFDDQPGLLGTLDEAARSLSPSLGRSEEHTSELQSLMRISYAVFCLKKKKNTNTTSKQTPHYKHATLTKTSII